MKNKTHKKKKRPFHKVHKRLIDTIATIMGIIFVLSMCSVDSETWIPMICLCLSGAWLAWYVKINNWFYPEGSDEHVR